MRCHSCDAELNDGMRFCTACGAKLGGETACVPDTEQQQTSVSAAAATPDTEPQASVVTETVDRTEIKIKCHNCGTELNNGMRFCTACGAKTDKGTASALGTQPQVSVCAASPTSYYTQPQTKDYDLYKQTFEKRKSINPKKIIAIAVAVVVVAGIAVLVNNNSTNNRSDYYYDYNTTQRTTEPATSAAETEKTTEKSTQKATEKATQKATNPPPSTNKSSNNPIGVRKEFKDACDSYEKFIDEYVAFMKKDHSSMEYLSQSLEYLNKLTEWNEKFDNLGAMNDAETLYYLEVQSRTLQKMAEAY